jgi:tetratricopeptide (TPR) repeat protein
MSGSVLAGGDGRAESPGRPGVARLQVFAAGALVVLCCLLAVASSLQWSRILSLSERTEQVRRRVDERESLETAVHRNPMDPMARIQLGIYLTQHQLRDAAAVQFTTAYALAPREAIAAFSLGRFYLETGENRKSLPPLEQAASLAPQNPDARLYLGLSYLNNDNPQAARREFEESIRLKPSLPEAHLGLALVLTDRATAQQALKEIDEFIRLAANPGVGRVLLSRSYYQLQDMPRAIQAGRDSVRDEPDNFQAWQALGLALMEGTGAERAEAESCFRKVIQLAPRFADAHVSLARVYLRGKKYAEAAREFETAIRMDGNTGYVRYELGQAYQGAGRSREAKEQLREADDYMAYKRDVVAARRAIVANPRSAQLYIRLSRLYASKEAFDWAVPAMERAARLAPGDQTVQAELRRMKETARD